MDIIRHYARLFLNPIIVMKLDCDVLGLRLNDEPDQKRPSLVGRCMMSILYEQIQLKDHGSTLTFGTCNFLRLSL